MKLKPGDIVLVSFPFTDLKHAKMRPAVIISSSAVHEKENDYTLLFISSVIPPQLEPYELLFAQTHPDFKASGLKKESVFKANKMVTVQKELLKRKIGTLGPQMMKPLKSALDHALFFS